MSQQQPSTVIVQQPAPSNGLGIAGFIVSLIGLLGTCGALSPIGLILSLVAMFKRPRGFAIAGLILGLLGSIWIIIAVFVIGLGVIGAAVGIGLAAPHLKALSDMGTIYQDVQAEVARTGAVPPDLKSVPGKHELTDPWKHPYRLVPHKDNTFDIISDGPDGKPGTPDDITIHSGDLPPGQSGSGPSSGPV
jgi:hypothetical protein